LLWNGLIHPEILAKRVVFRPFAPEVYGEVYLAWKAGVALSPAAEALVRLVRGRVKECADIEDFKKGNWS
jgi:DNA-binding transcriptional LysR family regulator